MRANAKPTNGKPSRAKSPKAKSKAPRTQPRTRPRTAMPPSDEPGAAKLAALIRAYAPHDGAFELRIPGLHASPYSRISPACVHGLRLPCLSIIAQGAKAVTVGQEVYEYDPSRMLVYSVALPVAAQVTRASHSEPYLALRLDLEPQKIAELVLKVFPHGVPPVQERSAVYITTIDGNIIDAAIRLIECLAQPRDAELLAPLVMDEILIRLLRSPIGIRVAQMGFAESSVQRIAKAITWLRANFSQPMKVEELAEQVHMSVSSFHEAVVVLEFPTMDAARAWYNSPAYLSIRKHRFKGAEYRCVLVQGV